MSETSKPIAIIESPFAGDIETNLRYARAAVRDSLLRGEAPYASHLLYPQAGILRDDVPEERMLGITAGFAFREFAQITAVYVDRGISKGMQLGIEDAKQRGHRIEMRQVPGWVNPG